MSKIALALASLTFLVPVVAVAQATTTDEKHVNAVFLVDSAVGCLSTVISASQVIQTNPKPATVQNVTMVNIAREFDGRDCATVLSAGSSGGWVIADGFSDQPPTTFSLDQRLTLGSLRTSVPLMFLESGAQATALIDLNWTGTVGQLSPERSHQTFPGALPGPIVVHSSGLFRPAQARGSVFDGATEYATAESQSAALFARTMRSVATKPRLLH
jgi:hypothetical protein